MHPERKYEPIASTREAWVSSFWPNAAGFLVVNPAP